MTAQEIIELVEIGLKANPKATRVAMNHTMYKSLRDEDCLRINQMFNSYEPRIHIVPSLPDGKIIVE